MGKNVLDKKVLRKVLDDAVDRAVEERIKPKVKKVLQKHIKEEVVNKDFVDSKKRYRKYYLTADVGPEGHKIKKRLTTLAGHASKYEIENNIPSNELGHGRTQTAKYTHMADDKYMNVTDFENNQFSVFNIMPPPGKSIFETAIEHRNDPLIYTKWIVEGDIVMPTLKRMSPESWDEYVKDPKNRYEARPFVDNAIKEIETKQFQDEISQDIAEIIDEELMKLF